MSEQVSFTVTLDAQVATWAAASAKVSTVERFLAETVAMAILDELDGGSVDVRVGDCSVIVVQDPGA